MMTNKNKSSPATARTAFDTSTLTEGVCTFPTLSDEQWASVAKGYAISERVIDIYLSNKYGIPPRLDTIDPEILASMGIADANAIPFNVGNESPAKKLKDFLESTEGNISYYRGALRDHHRNPYGTPDDLKRNAKNVEDFEKLREEILSDLKLLDDLGFLDEMPDSAPEPH